MHQEKNEISQKLRLNIRHFRLGKKLAKEKVALQPCIECSQLRIIDSIIINTTVFQIYRIAKTLKVLPQFVKIFLKKWFI